MALGRVPGLAVDRTGVALLGLIVLLASGDLTLEEAGAAVDMPTIALLFALMILSAQFEHSGFYGWVANRIVHAARSPKILLGVLIAVTGALSAIFTNDVVVFALTPLVAVGLMSQKLDPRPYLIGLAGAANAGFGRDADRQSAEHPDRPGRRARFLDVFPLRAAADARLPRHHLRRRGGDLAACSGQETAPDDAAAAADRPYPDGEGRWPRSPSLSGSS